MRVVVLKEVAEGEKRVAAVPATVEKMVKAGMDVCVESGAGLASGFQDAEYRDAGGQVAASRDASLDRADAVLKVQRPIRLAEGHELDLFPEGVGLIAYSLRARDDAE